MKKIILALTIIGISCAKPLPALGDDAIHVDSTGKVGISKNTPTEALHVAGKLKIDAGSLSGIYESNGITFDRSGGDSFIVQNQSSGSLRFMVGGEDMLTLRNDEMEVYSDNISFLGASKASCSPVITTSTGYFSCGSSISLKENIEPYEGGLDEIVQLRPVTFNWIDRVRGGNEREVGLIAEETDLVSHELATHNPEGTEQAGEPKGIAYIAVTVALVNAVRELKEQNDKLSAEIQELNALLRSR